MDSYILITLIFFWGLVHSIIASLRVKELIKKKLGERAFRYYRLVYNIFAGISFLPILRLLFIMRDFHLYSIPKPWVIFSMFAQFVSLMVLMIGLKQTGALEFLGMHVFVSGKNKAETQYLNTGGLFKIIRHPLYSAGFVLMWCSPVMTRNSLLVTICLSIYMLVGAIFEERKLIIEYGDIYRDYRKKVPMLIPCLKWNK